MIVCVATHYEGDPCDNTKDFFKWMKQLMKEKASKPFNGMKFAIFGLADSSYEQFNEMGIVFDKNFEELGGEHFFDMGVGNAETFSTEDDFNKWKTSLWGKLFDAYAVTQTEAEVKKAELKR